MDFFAEWEEAASIITEDYHKHGPLKTLFLAVALVFLVAYWQLFRLCMAALFYVFAMIFLRAPRHQSDRETQGDTNKNL